MAGLRTIKSLYLEFLWKEGVFKKLPPTPRPIEVGVVTMPPGSWTPAELRGKVQKDLITIPSTEEGGRALRTFLHELGHALFTPTPSQNPKFWEEYRKLGEFLNIVEDLRIEGKMSQILGFDLGKFPPSEKQPTVVAFTIFSAMIYLHLGYNVACLEEERKRAERLLKRLYKASAWSSLRLARYFEKKLPYVSPPKSILDVEAKDIMWEAPKGYKSLEEEAGGFLSSEKEKRGEGWLDEQVLPPKLPPAIIKLARELFKAPEPEWIPSSSGRLVVSSYLRGDEEPFVKQEELPTIHPLIVVDTSGSMSKIQKEARILLYALYKAGLKGSVLLVKNGKVKKVPIKDAYKASFDGSTEGLWACAPFINASPLTIVVSDLALSREDESKVRKSFSKKPNVYWVYWGSYKGEFLKNALRLEIPRIRVIAEDTLEGCLKKLSKLLRG